MATGAHMTGPWRELVPAALIGTERQAVSAPVVSGEIGVLLKEIAGQDASNAQKLLRMAGVLSICADAGARAEPAAADVIDKALAETRAAISDASAIGLLNWAFQESQPRLIHEICRVHAAARLRLPFPCLPIALEASRRHAILRPALQEVLGERGRWLASQNEAWQFATGVGEQHDIELLWAEGNLEQRVKLLATERKSSPVAARERIEKVMAELPARERAELVQTLHVELSPADEPFLNALLIDRSRDVRQAGVALLLRLPECVHTVRATTRLSTLLRQERVLLVKRWAISAPDAAGEDWKQDSIESERPKNESLGERAWWLYQLARQVPLAWWTATTAMDAKALIRWALAGDWAEALIRAWRDILMTDVDVAWCEALIEEWPQSLLRDNPATLLAKMPFANRERHLHQTLNNRGASSPLSTTLSQILAACPMDEQFSEQFSNVLVDVSVRALRDVKQQSDYWLRSQLPELFCAVHPRSLSRAQDLKPTVDDTPSVADTLHLTEKIIQTRRAINKLTESGNPHATNKPQPE